jgi:hypothetical protein
MVMFPLRRATLVARCAWCIAIIALLSICPKTYAPIHGGFEGIDKLIAEADIVVVATVLKQLSDPDFGGAAYYEIYRERTLRGDLDKEKLTVNMRQLDVMTRAQEASKDAPLDDLLEFRMNSRYVLFLKEAKGDKKARFENVNSEGSSFEVSRWFKLESLEGKPLKESLKLLLLHFRDYQRARLQHVEERTDLLLREL